MPADIFIQTGSRTFFTYLMRPILDSLTRAFRER
jgi:HlyD family secretion protein